VTRKLPDIDDDDDIKGSALLSEILHNLDEVIGEDADLEYRIREREAPYE
jgi:hypothetical protein